MADSATAAASKTAASDKPRFLPWSDWTWAAILLRVAAGLLLLLSGTDKFKSATSPATYSLENYYGAPADLANPEYQPKFVKIINVVYTNSGLDNANALGSAGKTIASTAAWSFYLFGKALPWLMIGSGFLILIGAFSRFAHFVGGFVWISLIAGQLLLPDVETVVQLLVVFLVGVGALALVQHNRIALTRG
jgi:uncharacterized membrane protein YphA (DoxX/SURF4 family)